jgi:hypothetical protein
MTTKGPNSYNLLIESTLTSNFDIAKPRRRFIIEIFIFLLSIKGRVNFYQLARYGDFGEQRYRQQFEKQFDFLKSNKQLTVSKRSSFCAIAIDPSYINKSGKHTPGVGYFWSDCAGKAKWGLEMTGIAVIDLEANTAFHLEAVQTFPHTINESFTLADAYAGLIEERKSELKAIANIIVADAWFSKKKFVDKVISSQMEIVSRFRNDADLLYLYNGPQKKGKGRPSKYDGKVIHSKLDENYFQLIQKSDNSTICSALVYSKSLKMTVKLVHVLYANKKGKQNHKLYFSTDLSLDPLKILNIYKARFQIEFLYRDAKQHTGLNDCQARCKNKLHFHINATLTAVNIAKIQHWIPIDKDKRPPFSMADIKTINNNHLQLKRFIRMFGINPYSTKNKKKIDSLIYYATIAA